MGREEVLSSTRPVSAPICWLTYIASLGWIGFVFALPQAASSYWNGLLAIVEATVVIFLFSVRVPARIPDISLLRSWRERRLR